VSAAKPVTDRDAVREVAGGSPEGDRALRPVAQPPNELSPPGETRTAISALAGSPASALIWSVYDDIVVGQRARLAADHELVSPS
jgi:hypothetical protein